MMIVGYVIGSSTLTLNPKPNSMGGLGNQMIGSLVTTVGSSIGKIRRFGWESEIGKSRNMEPMRISSTLSFCCLRVRLRIHHHSPDEWVLDFEHIANPRKLCNISFTHQSDLKNFLITPNISLAPS